MTPPRRWSLSLRMMFVGVGAIALLLAQYPYVAFEPFADDPDPIRLWPWSRLTIINREVGLTMRFVLIALAEFVAVTEWWAAKSFAPNRPPEDSPATQVDRP